MVAKYSRHDERKDEPGSPCESAAEASRPSRAAGAADEARRGRKWPREARLLKRSEFQQVYSTGRRCSTPFFTAFLLKTEAQRSRVGFTTPRALGNSVRRNRIKRRLREAVRLHLAELGFGWDIVFNPRRAVLGADFGVLEREVARLFAGNRQ